MQLQRMQDSTKEAFLKQRAMAKVQADRAEEELELLVRIVVGKDEYIL